MEKCKQPTESVSIVTNPPFKNTKPNKILDEDWLNKENGYLVNQSLAQTISLRYLGTEPVPIGQGGETG